MRPAAYVFVLVSSALVVCASTIAFVSLIDPLWYFSGNRLTGVNYPFNERFAKLVRFHRNSAEYDCAIFGSSRATVLNEHDIEGYDCFNFAVSSGRVAEFVEIAAYLRPLGFQPDLVIVGVDAFNFHREQTTEDLPAFVRDGEPPPSAPRAYLSLSAVNFSLRTLRGDAPLARVYGADFTGGIRAELPHTEVPRCIAARRDSRPFQPAAVSLYAALTDFWPEARIIGYVPPISVWDIAVIRLDGTLSSYLSVLHQASALFDEFYDFSIPSDVTADPANTVDGDHYYTPVNRAIAARLNGHAVDFGIRLTDLSLERYEAEFTAALRERSGALALRAGPVEQCYAATNAR